MSVAARWGCRSYKSLFGMARGTVGNCGGKIHTDGGHMPWSSTGTTCQHCGVALTGKVDWLTNVASVAQPQQAVPVPQQEGGVPELTRDPVTMAQLSDDVAAQLRQLAHLHASGQLTDAEFAAAKARVLRGYASRPTPVDVRPWNLRGVDEIANKLAHSPVTLTGPEQHWCIQAIANGDEGYVHVEILDPVHWGNGPALPESHLQVARELGFEAAEGMWMLQVPGQEEADLAKAAETGVPTPLNEAIAALIKGLEWSWEQDEHVGAQ